MNKTTTTLYRSIVLLLLIGFVSQNAFAQVFWSEDFTNGIPSDWDNVDLLDNNGEWTWCDNPTQVGGGCPGITVGQMAFGATTASTGFITVASDEIGTTNNTHTSVLTTSAINCSAHEEVYLTFETTIGIYQFSADENVFFELSTDNTTWEEFLVFPTLFGTQTWSPNPELISFNLTDFAAGESTVYLRWRWVAGWEYYWNIDDVKLHASNPAPPNDLRVNTNWFATHLNSRTPASQVDTFGFMADIENIGSTTQHDVSLNVEIVNDTNPSVVLYDVSLDYDSMEVGELIQNELFPDPGFLPAPEPGTYTAAYTITANSMDADFSNNVISFGFEISDSTFSKDSGINNATGGAPPTSVWGDTEPYSWAYGNYYYIPNGAGKYATKASFAIANASDPGIPGKQVNVRLYKWLEDTDGNEEMDPSEREWVGYAIYEIAGYESSFELITVSLSDPINDEPVALEDDAAYVLMIEHSATDQRIIAFMITQDTDYAPAIYRSQELGDPRYAALIGFGDPLSAQPFSTFGFGRDVVPVAHLHISEYPIDVKVEDVLSPDNKLTVFPNPASDFISVNIELVEQQKNAAIEIVDLNGKVVKRRKLENLQEAQLRFDLEGLSVGNYFLNLITPKGQRTVAFAKQKN